MGTYLHPILKDKDNDATWEILARVPSGTANALVKLEAGYPNRNNFHSKDEERFYQALFATPTLDRLHGFQLFGWGKTTRAFGAVAQKHGYDTAVGSLPLTGNSELVRELLFAQGLGPDEIIPHISGLCWG